jgi:hypothetical protein
MPSFINHSHISFFQKGSGTMLKIYVADVEYQYAMIR